MALQMSTREKYAVSAAAVAVAAFLIIQFLVTPLVEKNKRLKRAISLCRHDAALGSGWQWLQPLCPWARC